MVELLSGNKAASRLEIKEKFEAGLVLTGSEVKSIRQKQVKLDLSFVRVVSGEPLVFGMRVGRYSKSGAPSLPEDRVRKLLLKRPQIDRLTGFLSQKGYLCLPLRIYSNKGLLKLEIGVGRTLKKWQKKAKLIERQEIRDTERLLKDR